MDCRFLRGDSQRRGRRLLDGRGDDHDLVTARVHASDGVFKLTRRRTGTKPETEGQLHQRQVGTAETLSRSREIGPRGPFAVATEGLRGRGSGSRLCRSGGRTSWTVR